jgi:hypothetical protein
VDPNVPNQNPNPYQQPPQAPYPQAPYPQAPYPQAPETPQWGVPAPTKKSGFLGGLIGGAVAKVVGSLLVIAVITGGYMVYQKVVNPDHRGQVIFTSTSAKASDNCKFSDRVETIKAGDTVYMLIMWSRTMKSSDTILEEDILDGTSLGKADPGLDSSSYAGADCTTVINEMTSLFGAPGVYEFKFTVGDDVVADGKLSVTAP